METDETVNALRISPPGVEHTASSAFGIAPQWDYVLCEVPERADRSRDGGLIIMPGVGADKNEALVLACGPGVLHDGKRVPMPAQPGDRVIMAAASYHPIHADGKNMFLAKAGLIIAKVTESVILLNAGGKKNYAAQYEAHHVAED